MYNQSEAARLPLEISFTSKSTKKSKLDVTQSEFKSIPASILKKFPSFPLGYNLEISGDPIYTSSYESIFPNTSSHVSSTKYLYKVRTGFVITSKKLPKCSIAFRGKWLEIASHRGTKKEIQNAPQFALHIEAILIQNKEWKSWK